jgi:hypothetical protein
VRGGTDGCSNHPGPKRSRQRSALRTLGRHALTLAHGSSITPESPWPNPPWPQVASCRVPL